MKKWLTLFAVVLIAGYSVRASILQDDGIPGVNGDLILIEKNAETAQVKDKISVNVGDKIEITWTYPIVPASLPKKVEAKSDSDSVKFNEIRRVSRPKLIGSGTLGAFFVASQ
jgi:hypothetical protein